MGLRDLFVSNDDLLRDPDRLGTEVVYFDPVTTPATQRPVDAIFENLGVDPLVQLQHGDEVMEQGTIDLPVAVAIDLQGWFTVDGTIWKITGLGGSDSSLKTITVQHPIPISKRIAKRRG